MADNSTTPDPKGKQIASDNVPENISSPQAEVESENEEDNDETNTGATGTPATGKKKKSKRKKIKAALGVGSSSESSKETTRDDLSKAVAGLNGDLSGKQAAEAVRKLSLEDIMTGLASSESSEIIEEGPFKIVDPAQVPKEPGPLISGFNWVTMDMTSDEALQEVFELLYGHYVEDDEAMFRFNYSKSFLRWALMSPGWQKEWHVGVRATASGKLVAFISAIPVALRVRNKTLKASEVNFLCIHKKLRSKRLAPVLIKEITRRCYLEGTWQAIYTAGVVLPKPVIIWCYVVEDPTTKKLTDFFSFYCLESSVIGHAKHTNVRAAYLFYYASTLALDPTSSRADLGARLNELIHDALIIAKKYKFDVFNALTLMDNTLFLEQQKFGAAGDGQLHYYLYNYKANNIAGGVDKMNRIHDGGSGVGVVML
ncbi:hypothetical protein EYC84_006247 [Monilinia fructicola]|uniref:Glycylpeptide N-tetradecanoyltransferase n=1 Tax=Monilinia fructicola TaxID=38448 RepID=A0A5M9KAZ6_MONFR|nr:hypothetical protein EYC84_006247 [Monilinia fructicola]